MAKIVYTKTARNDLRSIYDYIARDSLFYAEIFIDRLMTAAGRLEKYPQSGRVVPEISDKNVREIIYRAYRIMYLIDGDNIYITQITHCAQDFKP